MCLKVCYLEIDKHIGEYIMKKILLTILTTLLLLTSCDYGDLYGYLDTSEFAGSWSSIIENTDHSKTEKRLVFTDNSYAIFLDTTIKLTDTVTIVEMERGNLSQYTDETIILTQTYIYETTTHSLTPIAPSFQEEFYIDIDVSGDVLTVEDFSISTTHQNTTGTFFR